MPQKLIFLRSFPEFDFIPLKFLIKIVSIELEFERFVLRAVSVKGCSVNILKPAAYE